MSAAAPEKNTLPQRSGTVLTHNSSATTAVVSDDEAIPEEDTSEVTKLFAERIRAWKHACANIEEYIKATEKLHVSASKDYEKVLKTISGPLREGHHFDQSLGGIAGLFDNIRSNTQGIANSHSETAKALKSSILPTFERLHAETKSKTKELVKGAGKGAKAVDKARNLTQKHIELLGQHAASFDSTGGKIAPDMDPYILQRGVMHRLNKQILEENSNRQDLLAVQTNFATFESHVVQTFQSGLGQFHAVIAKQEDVSKSLYGDIVATAKRIPVDFEWMKFLVRYNDVLIDPTASERNINSISFPNQDHRATVPLISGSLERKSKILRKYETYFYVVTASKYLHEFKTDDDFAKDPVPENSLYLPDSVIGAIDGDKFILKGKDVSKSKIGINLSTSHEYNFKAHTHQDAAQWWEIIRTCTGQVVTEKFESSTPTSPSSPQVGSDEKFASTQPATTSQPAASTATTTPAQAATTTTTPAAQEKAATEVVSSEKHPVEPITKLPEPTTHVASTTATTTTPSVPASTSATPGEAITKS